MLSKPVVQTVSKEITDAIQPLLKWIAVHHAIERGDSDEAILAQFPWIDLGTATPTPVEPPINPITPPVEPPIEPSPPEVPKPNFAHPNVPTQALERIWTLTGMVPSQVDTVMSLVSCAENGSSNWPIFYNYIEYGHDANIRGYTTTIFGACSGTGSLRTVFEHLKEVNPSHPLVVKYWDAMQRVSGGHFNGITGLAHVGGDHTKAVPNWGKWTRNGRTHLDHIEGDLAKLPLDDQDWRLAVWSAFINLNWESVTEFCAKTGMASNRPGPIINSALGKGIMVDTSVNHGDASHWESSPTWKIIFEKMGNVQGLNEKAWLVEFLQARKQVLHSGYKQLDWSKSGSRCDIWLKLIAEDNMDLSRPINIANSIVQSPLHPIWPDGLVLDAVVDA